jgi:hypothetical protein
MSSSLATDLSMELGSMLHPSKPLPSKPSTPLPKEVREGTRVQEIPPLFLDSVESTLQRVCGELERLKMWVSDPPANMPTVQRVDRATSPLPFSMDVGKEPSLSEPLPKRSEIPEAIRIAIREEIQKQLEEYRATGKPSKSVQFELERRRVPSTRSSRTSSKGSRSSRDGSVESSRASTPVAKAERDAERLLQKLRQHLHTCSSHVMKPTLSSQLKTKPFRSK